MDTAMLKSIYLFSEFSDAELKKVAAISEDKNVMPGQDIFSVGQDASAMYVVVLGSVQISVSSDEGDEIRIRNFGSGSHFGEMPFIDGGKRSATVTTMENSHVAEIPYGKLQALLEQDGVMACKFYRSTARFLASRLRATTTDLNQMKELKFQQ